MAKKKTPTRGEVKKPIPRTSSNQSSWPEAFKDAAGSAPDFPDVETLRTGYGQDSPRIVFK